MAFDDLVQRARRELNPASMKRRARAIRFDASLRKFPQRWVEHRYGSRALTVSIADPFSENWYDHDWEDLPEIALLRQGRLRPGATVFDLGAHQGIVALMLAAEVGQTGTVIAVEAHPHNARVARANTKRNDVTNLRIKHAAVAEKAGSILMNMSLGAQVATATKTYVRQVPSITVDDLAERFGAPDVLIIDVEGYETQVLEGAERTMERRPDCSVEVHAGCGLEDFGGSAEGLVSYFLERGYEVHCHTDADPTPVPVRSPSEAPAGRMFLTALQAAS